MRASAPMLGKRAMDDTNNESRDIAGVIAPPPLIFGIPLFVGLIFHELVGGFDFTVRDLPWLVRAAMGPGFVIFGAGLIATAILAFRKADTPAEPWEETRTLTFKGPYRLTRNPMYLGMAMIYFGMSILAGCYLLLAMPTSFWGFLGVYFLVAVGHGMFKPVVISTVAKSTNEKTGSMGFGAAPNVPTSAG